MSIVKRYLFGPEKVNDSRIEVRDFCLSRSLIVVSQEEPSLNQGRRRCWRLGSYKLKRLDVQDYQPYEF